jgi:hypothetical protein
MTISPRLALDAGNSLRPCIWALTPVHAAESNGNHRAPDPVSWPGLYWWPGSVPSG